MPLVYFVVLSLIALSAWLAWRSRLVEAGRRALSRQPETITFIRVPGDKWRDPVMAEWLSAPLREKGFVSLGVYEVLPLPDFRLGVMLNERDKVAAFLCENPKALGISLELNVRYADGTTTMLVNRADRGVPKPPFFRVIHAEPDTPSGALYERLLRERAPFGIKTITAENVIPEYQAAWTRMILWEKGRGLTADEVSKIAQRGRSLKEDKANLQPRVAAGPSDEAGLGAGDAPCPHCGRLNEKQREVCWACYRLLCGKAAPVAKSEPRWNRANAPDGWSTGFPGESSPQAIASRKKRAAQILVAAPGILILSLALHGIFADYRHVEDVKRRLEARTAQAEGTIVELHDAWHGTVRTPKETVVFTAASGQQVRFSALAHANDKVGGKMQVRYDPREDEGQLSALYVLFAMGLFYLFLAVMLGRPSAGLRE